MLSSLPMAAATAAHCVKFHSKSKARCTTSQIVVHSLLNLCMKSFYVVASTIFIRLGTLDV